ncbi:MAG: 4a-hydroxytetrahydrobiopterin dehydratase [Ignavibacteria bacterium]|nr:4a-hydroxytetrahydrobiopterin dehydratase [Ignavibacteria bacterium]
MNELAGKTCEACNEGAPLATQEEIDKFMLQIPDWKIIKIDRIKQLRRTFTFNNFVDALSFSNKVGAIAEEEGHHPAILTEWGKVTVTWWTHKIKGLHVNDFIMAAKTDKLI